MPCYLSSPLPFCPHFLFFIIFPHASKLSLCLFSTLALLFDLLMRFDKTLMGSGCCWCQQSFLGWLWSSMWSSFPAGGPWWGSISITVSSWSARSNHGPAVITQRMGLIFDASLIYSKTHRFNVHTDTWRWTIYERWWTPLPLSFNASLIFQADVKQGSGILFFIPKVGLKVSDLSWLSGHYTTLNYSHFNLQNI